MRKNWNIYNTEVLNSNLCGYKDAYILVKGDIAILWLQVTQVTFKDSAPFTKCTTKVFRTTVDDAEDLCIVMPMHNVIEYSSIYLETNGLWFYSKDQTTNFNVDVANNNFKSFKYKAKSLENIEADGRNKTFKNSTVTRAGTQRLRDIPWRCSKGPIVRDLQGTLGGPT